MRAVKEDTMAKHDDECRCADCVAEYRPPAMPTAEPRAFLAWCYEVAPGQMALLTKTEVERRGFRSGKEIESAIARLTAPRAGARVLDAIEELLDAPPVDSAAYVLLLEEYVQAAIHEAK